MKGENKSCFRLQTSHCAVCLLQDHVWDASHYLVRLVFSGLKEMFTGTREIQVGPTHLRGVTVKSMSKTRALLDDMGVKMLLRTVVLSFTESVYAFIQFKFIHCTG